MSLSAPKVMSNLPWVSSLASCATRRTSIVSRLTVTGVMPAALFRRTTSLLSFHTLSSDSSRSNSRNTCSNASSVSRSFVVQAESFSCDPIDTRERSTSFGVVGTDSLDAHPVNAVNASRPAMWSTLLIS